MMIHSDMILSITTIAAKFPSLFLKELLERCQPESPETHIPHVSLEVGIKKGGVCERLGRCLLRKENRLLPVYPRRIWNQDL